MSTANHPRYPNALAPFRLGKTELRNRLFMPAHTTSLGEDNLPSARHVAYHRARARGGVGLIIFEAIRVHKSSLSRWQGVSGFDRSCIPHYAAVAKAVQAEGARLFGQVIHLGRQSDGNYSRTPAWGASPRPWTATAPVPHPMTKEEIAIIVKAHADVALNLLEAGFDGIEVQCGHGHLLQQFLSASSNHRDDDYGGSEDNRLRMMLETVRAVREAIGPCVPMGIRVSGDEFLDDGPTIEDMSRIVPRIAAAVPLDFVHVSHSAYHGSYSLSTQMADMSFPQGSFHHLPRQIRSALGAAMTGPPPVLAVCQVRDLVTAEALIASGAADMVGMARAHIADPEIVNKSRDGREDAIMRCIGCNQGCAGYLEKNLSITCLINPAMGRENAWPALDAVPAAAVREVLVVGGGPAGLEAAAVAAARGHRVTLWEKSEKLGGQLNWLKAMPLREEFFRHVGVLEGRCATAGVQIESGRTASASSILAAGPDHIILATGGHETAMNFPDGGRGVTLSEALADVAALGASVCIVDTLGDWATAATAEFLADLGLGVTLVSPTGAIAFGVTIYSSFALKRRLRDKGVIFRLLQTPHSFDGRRFVLQNLGSGEKIELSTDSVIAPASGVPNDSLYRELANSKGGSRLTVTVVGDALAPRTALEAIFEGHEAAREI